MSTPECASSSSTSSSLRRRCLEEKLSDSGAQCASPKPLDSVKGGKLEEEVLTTSRDRELVFYTLSAT